MKAIKQKLYNLFTFGMSVVFVITFAFYSGSEKQIENASEQRYQSFLLADEL